MERINTQSNLSSEKEGLRSGCFVKAILRHKTYLVLFNGAVYRVRLEDIFLSHKGKIMKKILCQAFILVSLFSASTHADTLGYPVAGSASAIHPHDPYSGSMGQEEHITRERALMDAINKCLAQGGMVAGVIHQSCKITPSSGSIFNNYRPMMIYCDAQVLCKFECTYSTCGSQPGNLTNR